VTRYASAGAGLPRRLDAAADEFIAYAVDGPAWIQRSFRICWPMACRTQPQECAHDAEQVLTLVLANLQGAIAESGAW